jgi:hypothetical protein
MAELERPNDLSDFKAHAAAEAASLDHDNLLRCEARRARFWSTEMSTLQFS